MKIGVIKPTYPHERRVALLPKHIQNNPTRIPGNIPNEIELEEGFGSFLDIPDREYENCGIKIKSRSDIFASNDIIFCMKLIQQEDYESLREGQIIIGWTHPTGSGYDFMREQAIPKKLKIVDLDNIYPAGYYLNKKYPIDFIPKNFIWKNSFNAGYCAMYDAMANFGRTLDHSDNIAILGCGNVSQGAANYIGEYTDNVRMFNRKTIDEFYNNINKFNIIVNGIETDGEPVIKQKHQEKMSKGTLFIDAAADPRHTVEFERFTTWEEPIYKGINDVYYYCINNTPSVLYRKTSDACSEAFCKYVFNFDLRKYIELFNK